MIKRFTQFISALSVAVIAAISILIAQTVLADASIGMTTSNGTAEIAGDITVNVEITSDEQIGTYYIELAYDSSRMRYVSGAESEQDGILTLTGTGMSKTIKYVLEFTGAQGGEAGIVVRGALVNNSGGSPVNASDSGMLQIIVTGQTDNSASFSQKLAEEQELLGSDLPISGSIHDPDGNTYYVVDLTRTTPDIMTFDFETIEETFEGQQITFATDKDGVLKIIPLMDADENVSLYAVNGDMFYPMSEFRDNSGDKYVYVSMEACGSIPQKLASDTEMWEYVIYAVGTDGKGGFYLTDGNGNIDLYTVLNSSSLTANGWLAKVFTGKAIPWERYLLIAAMVVVGIIVLSIILWILNRTRKRVKVKHAADALYDYYVDEPVSVDEDIDDIDVVKKHSDVEEDIEKTPVSRRVKNKDISGSEDAEKNSGRKVKKVSDDAEISAPAKKKSTRKAELADKKAPEVSGTEESELQDAKGSGLPDIEAPADVETEAAEVSEIEATAVSETEACELPGAAPEVNEKIEDILSADEADNPDDDRLSLDDIVLTEEDVPGGMPAKPEEQAENAESVPESAAAGGSGPKSNSDSESYNNPDNLGKTIRFGPISYKEFDLDSIENAEEDGNSEIFTEDTES